MEPDKHLKVHQAILQVQMSSFSVDNHLRPNNEWINAWNALANTNLILLIFTEKQAFLSSWQVEKYIVMMGDCEWFHKERVYAFHSLLLSIWEFLWKVLQYANHMAIFSPVWHDYTPNGSLVSGQNANPALPDMG